MMHQDSLEPTAIQSMLERLQESAIAVRAEKKTKVVYIYIKLNCCTCYNSYILFPLIVKSNPQSLLPSLMLAFCAS